MKTLVKISLIVSVVSFMVSFSLYFSVYSSGVGTNGYYEDPTDLKFTHKYLNPEGSINSGVSLDLSEKIALPGLLLFVEGDKANLGSELTRYTTPLTIFFLLIFFVFALSLIRFEPQRLSKKGVFWLGIFTAIYFLFVDIIILVNGGAIQNNWNW